MKLYDLINDNNKNEIQRLKKVKSFGEIKYNQYMQCRTAQNCMYQQQIYNMKSSKIDSQKDIIIECLSRQNKELISRVLEHEQQESKFRRHIKKLQRCKSQKFVPKPFEIIRQSNKVKQGNKLEKYLNLADTFQVSSTLNKKKSPRPYLPQMARTMKHTESSPTTITLQTENTSFALSQTPRKVDDYKLCEKLFQESQMIMNKDKKKFSSQIQQLNRKMLRLIEYPTANMKKQQKTKHRQEISSCVLQLKKMKKQFQMLYR